MAQRVTVVPYEYREENQTVWYFTQNGEYLSGEMWPGDLTNVQCACRILSTWLGIIRMPRDDWDNFKQLAEVGYQELSYHVAVFSVMPAVNVLFVPIPNLETPDTPLPLPSVTIFDVDISLLTDRFKRAMAAGFFSGALSSEAIDPGCGEFIPHPDYAVFHFNNYAPFKGFGEAWFAGLFMKPGETWAHYMIPDNQFPSEETLENLKGIVMTGGRYSAYDHSHPWLGRLKDLLKRCVEDFPNMKLIGVCLGAQLLAESLGGKVAASSKHGRIYKLETIVAKKELKEIFPSSLPLYNIPENHSDEITTLPPGAVLLGSSESCDVEMYVIPGRALMTQSHPNYVGDFQKSFHAKRMYNRGILSLANYQDLLRACEELENHSWPLIKLMEEFLKTST